MTATGLFPGRAQSGQGHPLPLARGRDGKPPGRPPGLCLDDEAGWKMRSRQCGTAFIRYGECSSIPSRSPARAVEGWFENFLENDAGVNRIVLLAAVVLAASATTVEAQQISRTGRGNPRLDARIDEVIRSGRYRLLSNDTTIAATDTVQGPVLVAGTRMIVEGTIIGDLVAIDANVYLRPQARITGKVLSIAGGLYRSEQVELQGGSEDHPLAPYHVDREDGRVIIVGNVERDVIDPDGLFGFTIPTANRVDGITPRWGATLNLPALGRIQPSVYGWVAYATQRDSLDKLLGGGEFRLRRSLNSLTLGAERRTITNDWWIRSDLRNTLSFLWNGKNYRNYYDAKRLYAEFARDLSRDKHIARAFLLGLREDASSLFVDDPFVLFNPDSLRINPPIR